MNDLGRGFDRSGFMWGLLLIGLGAFFLLERLGLVGDLPTRAWWVIIPALMAVAQLAGARSASDVGDGVTWLLFSVWFYIAVTDWHGLGWAHSWPLVLVAIGAGMVVRVIAGLWLPDKARRRKERDHA